MIEDIDSWKKAGSIAAQVRDYGASLIKPGVSLLEVADKVEAKIFALGGKPAFPAQLSLNDVAAHDCPGHEDKRVFKEGDLVKLDVGVHVNGCIGDTARTIDLGVHKDLTEASRKALEEAIKLIRPGITLAEVGRTIQQTISSYGFSPIKNLSGHGVAKFKVHTAPSIPNYDTNESTVLKEGMTIAIEPFATNGQGMIYEETNAEVFDIGPKKAVRNMITRQVLAEIETYKGLPFTTRWLTKKFPLFKVNMALRELDQIGMLKAYPPLTEKVHGLVSQWEHTIIVGNPCIILTEHKG